MPTITRKIELKIVKDRLTDEKESAGEPSVLSDRILVT